MSEVIVYIGLIIVILVQAWERNRLQNIHSKEAKEMGQRYSEEQQYWNNERQQLLDRIQAPSYDVMKHHEVKIIKAQNGEKEPPKLEVL